MDPQANLTAGARDQPQHRRAVDGRRPRRWPGDARSRSILPTETAGIDVAPGAHRSREHRGRAVHRARPRVDPARGDARGRSTAYDYVLIDCPPNLGLLTVNGLVAADSVIIPVQTQYYAMKGLNNLVKVINTIRLKLNRNLRILGLLPTFFDGRTNLAKDMLDELRVVGDHHVFNTIIRNTVKLGEAPLVGPPDHVVRQRLRCRSDVSRARPGGDRTWPGLISAPPPRDDCPRSGSSPPRSSACSRPDTTHRSRPACKRHPGRPDRAEPRAARASPSTRTTLEELAASHPRARRAPADPRPARSADSASS